MASEEQIEANGQNAQKSTGPKDTTRTRMNAVKYGLFAEMAFGEEQEKIINEIHSDLCDIFNPENRYEEFLVTRMAMAIFRIQHAMQIEESNFANGYVHDLIKKQSIPDMGPPYQMVSCQIDEPIDLIQRYITTYENRLLKFAKYFQDKGK